MLVRVVGTAIAVAWIAVVGGCSGRTDDTRSTSVATNTPSITPAVTLDEPGSSPANPLPQPVTPTLPRGWVDVTAGNPELPVDALVPAQWIPRAEPAQAWARIRIEGSFIDTQATNGQPMGLVPLFRLIGSKGKEYRPIGSIGYQPTFSTAVVERLALLSEAEPVVAPPTASGYTYFLVDSNDTDLRVRFMDFSRASKAMWL
jgi:hypothetical protein